MRAIDAYADLRRFQKQVVTTDDVAVRLRTSASAASRLLKGLDAKGLIRSLRHGLWAMAPEVDPMVLPEYLTAPLPAYVSLQTALYRHGMVEQIPEVVYAVSLARARRVTTSVATFSIHRVAPEFFGGFHEDARTGIKMATPEKALLDVCYLAAAKSRMFVVLPELELPRGFDRKECRRWIAKIGAAYRRTMVESRLDAILRGASSRGR